MEIIRPSSELPTALKGILNQTQVWAAMTGAGISAESGVPTFRDAQTGLWSKYRPEELASPEGFRRHPDRVWDWYAERRRMIADARPNLGHTLLASLQDRVPSFQMITQNVDGLHQQAGARDVIELHGNIHRTICFDQHHPVPSWEEQEASPPRCPVCQSLLRPDVVWFGEPLPEVAMQRATAAASCCEVFFSIGTSSLVYPAAGLAHVAKEAGAILIELNPEETALTSQADFVFQMAASRALEIIASCRKGTVPGPTE